MIVHPLTTPSSDVPLAQWINTDGSSPTTFVAYDIKYNRIFLSGDVGAYNIVFNYKPASPVVGSGSSLSIRNVISDAGPSSPYISSLFNSLGNRFLIDFLDICRLFFSSTDPS